MDMFFTYLDERSKWIFKGREKEEERKVEWGRLLRIRKLVILVIVVGKRTHVSNNQAAGNQSKYCNS